jgi:ubiquinone/menaquinone biosynthesis C-methylase UbiE
MVYGGEYERILARTYDAVYGVVRDPSDDVAFYVEQARESGGPVLELGCGTGRILIPTARSGPSCVGLDASPEMLAVLRGKNPPENVELVNGRMEAFDLGERRFRLVTAPFRAMQHLLDVEAQLRTLENVRRHLAPGGAFVFDVFDPKLDRMAILEEPESEGVSFILDGHEMRRRESIRRDLSSQVMTVIFRVEGGPVGLQGTTEIKMRWYYRYELEHLLKRAGFANLTFYGGFAKRPWRAGEDITVVARMS